LISFVVRFPQGDIYECIRRLRKNYFHQEYKERNDLYLDWRYIIQLITTSDNVNDFLTYSTVNEGLIKVFPNVNFPINNWYNEEEETKEKWKKINKSKVEEWEDHCHFMGDLNALITLSLDCMNDAESYYSSYLEFHNPTNDLRNEIFILRVCSDYYTNWFNLENGYRCIEQLKQNRIIAKSWFYKVWRIFTVDRDNRLAKLKSINKSILFNVITKNKLDDTLLEQINFEDNIIFTPESVTEFEKIRVKDWPWAGEFITAAIFYWLYLEKEYDQSQLLAIKDELSQIGIRMLDDKEVDESKKYSYGNLKIATHKPGGWYLYHSYSLMKEVKRIQDDKFVSNKIDLVDEMLEKVRCKFIS